MRFADVKKAFNMADSDQSMPRLPSLPSEIRAAILDYVFDGDEHANGLTIASDGSGKAMTDHDYSAARILAPLLVCRQLYCDGSLLAFGRTHFSVTNLYIRIPDRLAQLHPKQIEALRSISMTVDKRHFRDLRSWGSHAFACPGLSLESLTIVLHQSSQHYLFDFTADVVNLLRQLQSVQSLAFVRNRAHVKGNFKTWCNRLVGLIMKTDHYERYDVQPPNPEQTWWTWKFDDACETFRLKACPSKAMVDEETYMQQIKPLMQELMVSIESEEWNPDPRARNGT